MANQAEKYVAQQNLLQKAYDDSRRAELAQRWANENSASNTAIEAGLAVPRPMALNPTGQSVVSNMFNAANSMNAVYNAPRETYGLARPKMSQFIK